MDYPAALEFLFGALPMYQRQGPTALKANLDNIVALCSLLGSPQDSFRSIHVGGTNGKGSTSHMLASILQHAKYTTGLYTSPHLVEYTERIKVNGQEIERSFVANFVEKIIGISKEITPSFFEISVAMAFEYFRYKGVEYAVVEVGLGGRLDSTNILNPDLVVITNVDLDHTHILGNSVDEIAREKAGIIKKKRPVVVGESQNATDPIFLDKAQEMDARLVFADKVIRLAKAGDVRKFYDLRDDTSSELTEFALPEYQERNISTAIAAINTLRTEFQHVTISADNIITGLKEFKLSTGFQGRWQVLAESPLTICDTAHNRAGVLEVLKELQKLPCEKLFVVWGMVQDKDAREILSILPNSATYILTAPDIPRAMSITSLIEVARDLGLDFHRCDGVNKALALATSLAGTNDAIFVGGSTFVVAELSQLDALKKESQLKEWDGASS